MSLLCHSGCKEGIPIPFVGFVCVGMSLMCGGLSPVSATIQAAPGGDVGSDCQDKKCAKSRARTRATSQRS